MSIQLSTDCVKPKERSAYWQEVVSKTFVPLECQLSEPETFQGSIKACQIGDLSVVDVSAHQQTVVRNVRSLSSSNDEYVLVGLGREGRSRFTQEGREANLEAGDFTIYDTRRPYCLQFDGAFRQTVVQIPRNSLKRRVAHLEYLTALPMSRNNPLERMVFDFFLGLAALENQLSAPQQVRLSEQGLDLLAMALSQRTEGQTAQGSQRTTLLFRIKDYVHAHLSNPDLTLTEVSTRFSISPRYISSLFQKEQTSFGRYLLDSRLKHCARDLRDTALENRQISEIAYRWGFGDMAYFSRVFRARFGQPAREYRRG
ncbi:AraC family transcriptional regulator [Pseudomonas fluorescens]|uniref:AraC family transcriptional regulator n=1 Tax=Pseudomonas fluorescens TaxID=294 RepID=A0A327N9P1_PSEFL|nr:helix-turn-helix domain-containing protein [Pseudomonas fluorescens]RAI70846.1 AraC family transcriptional regulator [Pseudomonas fluorescens]